MPKPDKAISAFSHHQQHGASTVIGRKVKNKLKSGLSSPFLSSAGLSGHGNNSLANSGNGAASIDSPGGSAVSAGPASKLRGYQYFMVSVFVLVSPFLALPS